MKIGWRIVIGFLISILALTACYLPIPHEDDLAKAATVAAVPKLSHQAMVISDMKREDGRVSWKALTPEGEFTCNANSFFAQPACGRSDGRQ